MTRSGRSSRGGSRPDPSAFDGHFFDVATLCECCGQADPPSPAALLAQEATARRLADALPPPTPRGEAALELLEAFPGDKKATVTDMASGRLYIADLTPGVPAPYRELFVRVLSKALRPGGAGSVVLRQFTGERVEGGPKNIYGFLVSGDAEGDGIIRMTPQHNRMVQTLDAATGAPLGDEPGVSYL